MSRCPWAIRCETASKAACRSSMPTTSASSPSAGRSTSTSGAAAPASQEWSPAVGTTSSPETRRRSSSRRRRGASRLGVPVGRGDQDRLAVVRGGGLDRRDELGEERVGDRLDDQADGRVGAAPQRAGHQVRRVAQVLHHLLDPLAGGRRDPRVVVEDPRRGAQADPGGLRDVAQDAPVAHRPTSDLRAARRCHRWHAAWRISGRRAIDGKRSCMTTYAIDGKSRWSRIYRVRRWTRRGRLIGGPAPGSGPGRNVTTDGPTAVRQAARQCAEHGRHDVVGGALAVDAQVRPDRLRDVERRRERVESASLARSRAAPRGRSRCTTVSGSSRSQTSSGEPPAARSRRSSAAQASGSRRSCGERRDQDDRGADPQVVLGQAR